MTVPHDAGHIFNQGQFSMKIRGQISVEINTLYIDTAKLERAVNEGVNQTPTLSAALEYFATATQERKPQPQDSHHRPAERETIVAAKTTQHERPQTAHATKGAARESIRIGLRVADATGAVSSLSSFAESLLGMCAGRPEPSNTDDRTSQQRRASAALEQIAERIERGENLRASDLANLTPTHLENIKRHGDDYLREMIADMERYRQRDDDYSRSRER